MFKYNIKTKVIIIAIFIAVLIVMVIALQNYSSHSKDLVLVNQVRVLATGLENYYDKFNAYPSSDKIVIDNISYITENGLNQEGNTLYFKNNFKWDRAVAYSSNGKNYKIEFVLNNSWPLWGLDKGGGSCRMTYAITMQCSSDS